MPLWDYNKAGNITLNDFKKLTEEDIIYNYIVMEVAFQFPDSTQYPSIPVSLTESTVIYPVVVL